MKKYILKKKIFAMVLVFALLTFSAYNMWYSWSGLVKTVKQTDNLQVSDIEAKIDDGLYGRMNFIEGYGLIQQVLDNREVNNFDIIKDENGYLQYSTFFREDDPQMWEYAMRVKRLQDAVEKNGTKVLFVVPPSKYIEGVTPLRTGLQANDAAPNVTELLFDLNRVGVETLNLAEYLPSKDIPYEELFFKTDHHWTVPAAFYATQTMVETMKDKFDVNLDPDGIYTNPDSYDSVTYKGGMMGSMGRRTGAVYAGVDDFTALWPKYEGSYDRQFMELDGQMKQVDGNFTDTLMNPDVLTLKRDIYTSSQYSMYLNELKIYEKITNNENPDGKKIMMVRDSYFSPVIAFMMPMCGEIDAIWSLEESEQLDIESYVTENKFDYIIIEVYPYNINNEAFNFFKDE